MSKQYAKRKDVTNVRRIAKAGKPRDAASTLKPTKAPHRTKRQVGGLRASVNRGGKRRVTG